MQRCSKLQDLEEYFTPRGKRQCRGGYVTRICGYSPEIREFIKRYYKAAKKCGVVLEGKIPNPDEKQLAYYREIMGRAFQMDQKFLTASLRTWLPRMSAGQIQDVAEAVAGALQDLKNSGSDVDEYFADAGKFIIEKDKASIGMLQRMFKIGFNRAARIMDQLSDAGVVGPEEGTKPRKVLMSMEQFENYLEQGQ